jgi:hypothetical protein
MPAERLAARISDAGPKGRRTEFLSEAGPSGFSQDSLVVPESSAELAKMPCVERRATGNYSTP